jgi:hypothetical protein
MYKLTTHLLVALPVDGRVKKHEVNGGSAGNPNVERRECRSLRAAVRTRLKAPTNV